MNIYVFKSSCHQPVDAQVIGEELERLEKQNGVVDPHVLLDESRPEKAPLHKCFEWDDSLAAEKWRLEQSRGVIRSVEVIREDAQVREIAYVNVQSQGGYVSGERIAKHADLYSEAWDAFVSRVASARAQLVKLEQLAPTKDRPRLREAVTQLDAMIRPE